MNLDRYTTASQRLLSYAELNKSDSLLERNKGEIVYIFDTSVIEAYWRRDTASAAGRFGTDDLLNERVAKYSGWLALKFLMEGRLPAQGKRPGYVSPAHWNETLDRILKLEKSTRDELRTVAESPGTTGQVGDFTSNSSRLDGLLRQLANLEDPGQLLREAGRLGVGDTFVKIMQAVSRAERVRRTFQYGRSNQGSIRDLTGCSYYNELVGPKVRHQDFRRWQAAIAKHRNKTDRLRDGDRVKERASSKNIDSDAMTLASIQTMYRGNRDATGAKPRLKFVFVTADAAIHEAFNDSSSTLHKEGIPHFIRHPVVYAPLLNYANMTQNLRVENFTSLKKVFDRVEEALEPLFNGYDLQSALIQGYDRKLRYNIEAWSRNVETLCLANSHYVLTDAAGDYLKVSELASILSSPDVREAAAASVSADMGRIRDGHLQLMSLAALDQLKRARSEVGAGEPAEHRAPVKLIGVNIPGELGIETRGFASSAAWLESLLRSFRASQSDGSPDDVLESLREAWDDERRSPAAHLLASSIFFAVNSWETAKLCAQLCQRRIKRRKGSNPWLREARYCEALAIRMQLRSADDFRHASVLLTSNIADHSDPLAVARDRIERASLRLTAVIVQVAESLLPLDGPTYEFSDLVAREDVRDVFEESVIHLENAVTSLAESGGSLDVALTERVSLQAKINLVGAQIFAAIFGELVLHDPHSETALKQARSCLLEALEREKQEGSATARIYLCVSRALLSKGAQDYREAISLIRNLGGVSHTLSAPDQVEMNYLELWLTRALEEA